MDSFSETVNFAEMVFIYLHVLKMVKLCKWYVARLTCIIVYFILIENRSSAYMYCELLFYLFRFFLCELFKDKGILRCRPLFSA